MEKVTLLAWLGQNHLAWGCWINKHYIVASYDSSYAVLDRITGRVLWASPLNVGELPPLPINASSHTWPPLQLSDAGRAYSAW